MTTYSRIVPALLVTAGLTACGSTMSGFSAEGDAQKANRTIEMMGPSLGKVAANPAAAAAFNCGRRGVKICHVPPGNPDNRHTLCIGASAVQHHIDHHQRGAVGDYLGDCAGSSDGGSGGDSSSGGSDDGSNSGGGSTGGGSGGGTIDCTNPSNAGTPECA